MLWTCGVGEDSWESLGQKGVQGLLSILKEISPEYSLERLLLKLKLQYFGHLLWRTDSLEKTLMLGKIEGRRQREQQTIICWMASLTRWTWVWASSRSWWWTGKPGMLQFMGSQRIEHNWATQLIVSLIWEKSSDSNFSPASVITIYYCLNITKGRILSKENQVTLKE